MDTFDLGCALLSSATYVEGRNATSNLTPAAPGAVQIGYFSDKATGFEATAYQYQGRIVISYAGTDPSDLKDIAADAMLGFGITHSQMLEAADFYEKIKAQYGENVTFTGHSLGGGLAALMGVFFNKPAITFDPAPFRVAATKDNARALQQYLATATATRPAYQDADLASYATIEVALPLAMPGFAATLAVIAASTSRVPGLNIISASLAGYILSRSYPTFIRGESNIKAYAVSGEFLTNGFKGFQASWENDLRIKSTSQPTLIDINPQNVQLGAFDLHSISLLVAAATAPTLVADIQKMPFLAEQFFDAQLYKRDVKSADTDFLNKLVRSEYGGGQPTGFIAKFSQDLQRIEVTDGMVAQPALQKALTVAAMEYYYFSDSGAATKLFGTDGSGIHLDFSDIASPQSKLKSPLKLGDALKTYLSSDDWSAVGYKLSTYGAWHVQSGADAMNWTASRDARDVAVGGAQADSLNGGNQDDALIGGPGNDTLAGGAGIDDLVGGYGDDILDGGSGGDYLYGGDGTDRYDLKTGELFDIIRDSDGNGTIWVDGQQLTGGKKVAEDCWISDDKQWNFVRVGDDLIISKGSSLDNIRIRDWATNGGSHLGIDLSDEEVPDDVPDHTYTGDYIKKTNTDGTAYVFDADGNYAKDGDSPGAADVLNGSIENDSIQGFGGNDGIAGFAGDDYIDGGDGNDLLLGGYGQDTIEGGAGDDEISGSGFGYIPYPSNTNFTPPSSYGHPEWARGFSWVIYNPETGTEYIVNGVDDTPVNETTGNIIDGGTGNDRIGAGRAADTVHGGEGDDMIVGMGASDALFGDEGNDQMQGDGPPGYNGWSTASSEHAGDYMDGGAGDDVMLGEGADDVLFGDVGNDIMYGDDLLVDRTPLSVHGDDYLDGEDGKDTLVGGGHDDELFGGADDDWLYGDGGAAGEITDDINGNDYLDGEAGNDMLVGGGKADDLFGGEGNDTLLGDAPWVATVQQGNDYLDGEAGDDQLRGYGGDDQLFGDVGKDTLQGDAGNDYLDGEADDDILLAGDGNDTLYGGAGKDELQGGNGDDDLNGEAGNDKLLGQAGNDSLYGGADSDLLSGDAGNDNLDGGAGTDELQGGTENDSLYGGQGNDLLFGQAGDDTLDGGGDNDQLQGGDGIDALSGGSGDDMVIGDAGNDSLSGDDGRDELQGGAGSDALDGGSDNDMLFGQADADTLDGGAGNDILQGDDGADVYTFGRGGGQDTIYNWELNGGSVDVLQFAADVAPTDVIAYRSGADQVYAIRGSNDSITVKNYYAPTRSVTNPNTGVTTYYYDYRVEQVKFADGTVWTPTNTPNFYQAQLGGGTTYGGSYTENDVFAGTAAGDTFSGGYGSDTYLWGARSGRDTIIENGRTVDVDTIRVDASINPADVYIVRSGNDAVLKRRGSPDEMIIKDGVSARAGAFKVVFESDGTNWVLSDKLAQIPASAELSPATTQVAPPAQVQQQVARAPLAPQAAVTGTSGADSLQGTSGDDAISGLAGNDTMSGLAGNDTLDGGTGNDSMVGGLGDDTYIVDSATDVVVELAGEGTDTIQTTLTFTLPTNVENLTITGTSKASATGNALANVLTGNTANNTLTGGDGDDSLIGGGGTDALIGGKGNDYYVIDDSRDSMTENAGEGTDTVEVSFSYTLGTNFENLVITGAATMATGNAADNVLTGNALANTLSGAAGADTMAGGAGDDTYVVADTTDVIVENAGEGMDLVQSSVTYTLSANVDNLTLTGTAALNGTGNASANLLTGNTGNNLLTGGDGNDTLNGGGGVDTLAGGLGDDTYVISSSSTVVVENAGEGSDTVSTSATYTLAGGGIENLTLTGTAAINGTGDAGANVITGNDGANVLDGGAGNDTLNGGLGNDTLYGTAGDQLRGGAGDDTYIFTDTPGGDRYGTGLEDGGSGIDTLQSSSNISLVDYYYWSNADQNYHYVGAVENAVLTGTGNYTIQGTDSNNVLTGNSGNNRIYSWIGADKMDGGAGNDTLQGGNGATLVGGAGDDRLEADVIGSVLTMQGGTGNDWYYWDGGTATITENAGEGTDTLEVVTRGSTTTYTLGANVENLVMWGGTGVGNTLDNSMRSVNGGSNLSGGAGNDTMDGAAFGSVGDTLAGGTGDDTYIISSNDVITENANEGIDTVQASFTYTLAANFENLTLTGTNAVNGTGNASANVLTGNSAANVLTGGAGDDTYVVSTGDTVVENAAEGNDTIRTSITYSLASLANVENLELTGTNNLSGTGNAANNVLTGNSGANTLDGAAGADTMRGGAGNDTYIVDNASDVVTENADEGIDTVQSAVTYTLAANIENVVLTGSAQADATGNALDNTLTGNSAANVLTGGAGNDIYVITDALDTVVEAANEGTDTVQSSGTYTLGANVENLTLTGFNNANGTGNGLANVLTGNAAANVLTGGVGDDTYVVGSGDSVVENTGEGTDTVRSSVDWTLAANVENLVLLTGGAASGTGNALNNAITGNANWNTLDGGAGADTMTGGTGDDIYVVDDAGDVVVENAGEGTDTVRSSITRALGAEVENLVLTGTAAIDGTGNALANVITGNGGNNQLAGGLGNDTLDGAAGSDTLAGGAGDDVYVVSDAGDVVTEAAGEGVDTVKTSLSDFTLGVNVENLTLTGTGARGTGNELDNVLTSQTSAADTLTGGTGNDTYYIGAEDTVVENAGEGIDTVIATTNTTLIANIENLTIVGTGAVNGTGNELDNTLVGGAGANVLAGGAGNDTYYVGAGDTVVENAGEGTDTVYSSVTYTLSANVENLVLTGTAAIDGTGNLDANMITGNSANNVLDGGGAGADTLAGGAGDDTYNVQDTVVSIVENAGEGTDLVISTVDYTLGANLENLQLGGTTAVSGTGNELDNKITGSAADNILTGAAGDDTLDGGMGTDTLAGGTGNDTYYLDTADDVVVENAGEGIDTVCSRVDYTLGANIENLTLTGYTATSATGNALDNVVTGSGTDNVIDGGAGADTMRGGAGNDIYYVDDLLDVVEETIGANEGNDTVASTVSYTLDAELENLQLLGSAALTGTGNAGANRLVGNDGANVLNGGAGDDTLDGGLGADTLNGGSGRDTYLVDDAGDVVSGDGQLGDGDMVIASLNYTLGADIENLQLAGTASTATGNAYTNVLIGNDGDNVLDGAAGADSLIGGLGNDVYIVDDTGDWVAEYAGEGMDEVRASVSVTLAENVEVLTLAGSGALSGTGNAANNVLNGNAGDNVLQAGAGADLLAGGGGADTLTLGGGADLIVFNRGDGADTVTAPAAGLDAGEHNDTISLGGVGYADLQMARAGNDLLVKVAGTGDSLRLQDWYASAPNQTVARLQVVVDGTSDYQAGSGDPLRDAKVKTFDFAALVSRFDARLLADPNLGDWTPTEADLGAVLVASSDTEAMGGNLAWQFAHGGSGAVTFPIAQAQLNDAAFGVAAQAIDGSVPAPAAPQSAAADSSSPSHAAPPPDQPQASALLQSSATVRQEPGVAAGSAEAPVPAQVLTKAHPILVPTESATAGASFVARDLWAPVDAWSALEGALAAPEDLGLPQSVDNPALLGFSTGAALSEQALALQGSVTRIESVSRMPVAQL